MDNRYIERLRSYPGVLKNLSNRKDLSELYSKSLREYVQRVIDNIGNVKKQLEELITVADTPVCIGIEGEYDHLPMRITDRILAQNNELLLISNSLGSANVLMDITIDSNISQIQGNYDHGEALSLPNLNDVLANDQTSVGPQKSLFASGLKIIKDTHETISANFGKHKNVSLYVPTVDEFKVPNKTRFILFPGRKTNENDYYRDKLDLIIAIIDQRKSRSSDNIIEDAMSENNVPVIPVIYVDNINDNVDNVFKNIPGLRQFQQFTIKIANDDSSQIERLRFLVSDFISEQGNMDSNYSLSSRHERVIANEISTLYRIIDVLQSTIINNLTTGNINYSRYKSEVRKYQEKYHLRIEKTLKDRFSLTIKDFQNRINKANTTEDFQSVVDDIMRYRAYTKEFSSDTKILGTINDFKQKVLKYYLKSAIDASQLSDKSVMYRTCEELIDQFSFDLDDLISTDEFNSKLNECEQFLYKEVGFTFLGRTRHIRNGLIDIINSIQVQSVIDKFNSIFDRGIDSLNDNIERVIDEGSQTSRDYAVVNDFHSELQSIIYDLKRDVERIKPDVIR
jgi:hypothetical protein